MIVVPRCVVLVEGPSDAAALEVLGRRLGLAHTGVQVVPMGGVTNVGHHLVGFGEGLRDPAGRAVAGLCDGGEVRFVAGALRRHGHRVGSRADLEALGFFVCDGDLEDELIRAVGTPAVVEVVARQGWLDLLRTFQQQPAQRGRSLHDQLHRFAGTTSGRKIRFAAALAEVVPLDRVPVPLSGVLAFARTAVTGRHEEAGAG